MPARVQPRAVDWEGVKLSPGISGARSSGGSGYAIRPGACFTYRIVSSWHRSSGLSVLMLPGGQSQDGKAECRRWRWQSDELRTGRLDQAMHVCDVYLDMQTMNAVGCMNM